MAEHDDESGRIDVEEPRTVGDVAGRSPTRASLSSVGGDRGRIAEQIVAAATGEIVLDCPRCGEAVFLRRSARIGSSWRCENCRAFGSIDETPLEGETEAP